MIYFSGICQSTNSISFCEPGQIKRRGNYKSTGCQWQCTKVGLVKSPYNQNHFISLSSKFHKTFFYSNRFLYDHGSFNDQYLLTLSDSVVAGANIFQVFAQDSDSGPFSKISYQLASTNPKEIKDLFMIDAKTGKIFTLEGMKQLGQRWTHLTFCLTILKIFT